MSPILDLDAETDRIYQAPLRDFVALRDQLAGRLAAAGNKPAAAAIKALARPNVAGWLANQLYWTARPEFDRFATSTRELHSAQSEGAHAAGLREAIQARRQALAAVMARAESLLANAGHAASPALLRHVSDSLEALATEGAPPPGVRPGRLVRELEPPGFEALAGLAAPPRAAGRRSEAGPRAVPSPQTDASVDAQDDAEPLLAEAERRLDQARREAREAEGALAVAQKRAEGARGELEEATRRLERAKERAALLAADETTARREAERRVAARESAQAARDAAAERVRSGA